MSSPLPPRASLHPVRHAIQRQLISPVNPALAVPRAAIWTRRRVCLSRTERSAHEPWRKRRSRSYGHASLPPLLEAHPPFARFRRSWSQLTCGLAIRAKDVLGRVQPVRESNCELGARLRKVRPQRVCCELQPSTLYCSDQEAFHSPASSLDAGGWYRLFRGNPASPGRANESTASVESCLVASW